MKKNKILRFSAPWCGPCRAMTPVVSSIKKEYEDRVEFVEIDVDADPETAAQYGVSSIPTFIFINDEVIVKTLKGAMTKGAFKAAIDEAFELA